MNQTAGVSNNVRCSSGKGPKVSGAARAPLSSVPKPVAGSVSPKTGVATPCSPLHPSTLPTSAFFLGTPSGLWLGEVMTGFAGTKDAAVSRSQVLERSELALLLQTG